MTDKCRVMISGRMLYKRRRSPWKKDRKEKEKTKKKEKRDRSSKNSSWDRYSKSSKEYPHVQLVAWLGRNFVSLVKDLVL